MPRQPRAFNFCHFSHTTPRQKTWKFRTKTIKKTTPWKRREIYGLLKMPETRRRRRRSGHQGLFVPQGSTQTTQNYIFNLLDMNMEERSLATAGGSQKNQSSFGKMTCFRCMMHASSNYRRLNLSENPNRQHASLGAPASPSSLKEKRANPPLLLSI